MKKTTQHSPSQIFDDVLMLAASIAKLGRTITASKIQSTAESASAFVHGKMELPDLSAQLSGAREGLGNLSDYAVNTDVKQMVDDVSTFARKHPVTSLLAVAAVGALFTRLMRAEPATVKAVRRLKPKAKKIAKVATKPKRKSNGTAHSNA